METTLTPAPNATKVATKWALINALTGIVITYLFQFMNIDQASSVKYLSYIPFIVFLFLAQKEFRDELGGYISFGDAFSAGFRFSVFTGLILAVFIYLYLAILSPEVFAKAMATSETTMREKNNMSDDQIEKAMDIAKKWGPVLGAFFAAIGYAVCGAIIALIGAAIFKKERSPYDVAQDAIDPTETNV
jgi:hypothetical protein